MDYKQAIAYLESFIDYERGVSSPLRTPFRLDRVERLLGLLGSPQDDFRSAHIAGTNGKGSTAAMLAACLSRSGVKTGLYTSPHLETFRERIRINGEMITEDETAEFTERIRETLPRSPAERKRYSFFEIYTALCYLYFSEKNVELGVIETGLGGRLDATNVITPEICIITPIGLDHRRELGDTVAEIAREKCGIIKPRVPVITSCEDREALNELRKACAEKNASLAEVKPLEPLKPESPGKGVFLVEPSLPRTPANAFILHTEDGKRLKLSSPLPGLSQAVNAGTAAAAALRLGTGEEHIRAGLENTSIPGRLQFLPGKPPFLLDGGHNPPAAKNLAGILKTVYGGYSVTLIFGVSSDKDYAETAAEIFPAADRIILTRSENPRAADPELLKRELGRPGREPETASRVREAIESAVSGGNSRTLVCVTGSFFLVGEALALLKSKPGILKAEAIPHV